MVHNYFSVHDFILVSSKSGKIFYDGVENLLMGDGQVTQKVPPLFDTPPKRGLQKVDLFLGTHFPHP